MRRLIALRGDASVVNMPRAPSANRETQRVTVPVPVQENNPAHRYSFDEYKMYYESAEKVTVRRLAINSYNYTVCTAAIVAIAALTSWTWSRPEFRLITIGIDIFLPIMGILFCSLWVKQILDYKILNDAKFKVLDDMAEHISVSTTRMAVRRAGSRSAMCCAVITAASASSRLRRAG